MDSLWKQREATVINLQDAGCTQQFIDRFMILSEQGDTKGLFAMLAEHKELLLKTVHNSNHQIDCLDYLTYRMRKELK